MIMEQFMVDTVEALCTIRHAIVGIKADIDAGININNYNDKCSNYISLLQSLNYRIKAYKEAYEYWDEDELITKMYKAINDIGKYFDYYISGLVDADNTSFYNEINYIRDSLKTMILTVNVKLNFIYNEMRIYYL